MPMPPRLVAAGLLLLAPLASLPAQDAVPRPGIGAARSTSALGLWGGLARNSPAGLFGMMPGVDVAVTALRYTRTLRRSDVLAWDYAIDLVPMAWVSVPRVVRVPPDCSDEACAFQLAYELRDVAYGLGVMPVGAQLRFRPGARLQPYLAASAGMLRFRRPIPVPEATRLNFAAEAGGGVQTLLPRHLTLVAGYKLHHISNGGTGKVNPGIDSHMFYAGLLHRWDGRRGR